MKPDAILGKEADPLTKEEALALGYVVPDSYTEEVVPRLKFETIDQVLKIAHDNGLLLYGTARRLDGFSRRNMRTKRIRLRRSWMPDWNSISAR